MTRRLRQPLASRRVMRGLNDVINDQLRHYYLNRASRGLLRGYRRDPTGVNRVGSISNRVPFDRCIDLLVVRARRSRGHRAGRTGPRPVAVHIDHSSILGDHSRDRRANHVDHHIHA